MQKRMKIENELKGATGMVSTVAAQLRTPPKSFQGPLY